MDKRKIPWIIWKKVLGPRGMVRLDIRSPQALNIALPGKW